MLIFLTPVECIYERPAPTYRNKALTTPEVRVPHRERLHRVRRRALTPVRVPGVVAIASDANEGSTPSDEPWWRERARLVVSRQSQATGDAPTSRRRFLQALVLALVGFVAGSLGKSASSGKAGTQAQAVTLAPTPINPYARRRQKKQYEKYLEIQKALIERNRLRRKYSRKPPIDTDALPYSLSALSAFVASAISTFIVHPIDTIKTRLQMRGASCPLPPNQLYRGVVSNVWKEAPNAAIYLGVYEAFKDIFLRTPVLGSYPMLCFLLAGGLGDAIGSVVRVPAEILNKRLQLGLSATLSDAWREVFCDPNNREVVKVTWMAVLARDVPYGALQIAFYEQLKILVLVHHAMGAQSAKGLFLDALLGAIAGCAAAFLTTPADVIVTRLASQYPQSYIDTRRFMGVLGTARRIVEMDGWRGFFSGSLQRAAYYAPLIGLFFFLYETCRYVALHPETVSQLVTSYLPL
jgi:solute carrier family 25 S-adenosylmethionine transporter 26